ncbi:TPA: hypothetical protein ACS73C_003015 [Providencia alcalifaciens]
MIGFVIFLYTLKIASPFGIFIITFLIPNVIILIICREKKIKKKYFIYSLFFILIVLLSFLFTFYLGDFDFDFDYYATYYYITIPINIFCITLLIGSYTNILSNALFWDGITKLLISINLFFLLTQIILYYTISYSFDLGELTGGNTIRGITDYNGFMLLRPGGLYEEPSIFAAYMFSFLVFRFLSTNGKLDLYILGGVISLFLTISTISILLASLFLFFSYFKLKTKNIFILLSFILIPLYFLWDYISLRIMNSISGIDPSNSTKINVINKFISEPDFFWFGFGMIKKHLAYGLDGLGDTTIYTSLITIFGIIFGTILTLLLLFKIAKNNFPKRKKVLILLIFVKFSWPAYSFFWFLYLFFIFIDNISREKKR